MTASSAISLHRWTLIALSSVLASTPLSSAQPVTNIIWREEFDGDTLDTSVWSYESGNGEGGWGNGELQDYEQTNVAVENGSLKIVATKQDNMETGIPTFTSGRIKSQGKVAIKYGTIAARIKVPDVDHGLWPAFWTMGQNFDQVGWPAAGEIDIMEIGQGNASDVNRRVVSAAHWQHNGTYATYAAGVDTTSDLNNTWVVYYLDWTPLALKTYVGSTQVWEMNIDEATCTDCQELHQPHYLVLSMAVGGGFTGGGASSSSSSAGCASSSSAYAASSSGACAALTPEEVTALFPANMEVDWVRVYNNGYTEYYGPTPAPTPVPVAPVDNSTTQSPPVPAPVPAPGPDAQTPTAPTQGIPTPTSTVPAVPVLPTIQATPTQELPVVLEPIVPAAPTLAAFPETPESPGMTESIDDAEVDAELGFSSSRSKSGGSKSSGFSSFGKSGKSSGSFFGKSGKSSGSSFGKSGKSGGSFSSSSSKKTKKKKKHGLLSSSFDEFSTSSSFSAESSAAERQQPHASTTSFLVAGVVAVTSLFFALV